MYMYIYIYINSGSAVSTTARRVSPSTIHGLHLSKEVRWKRKDKWPRALYFQEGVKIYLPKKKKKSTSRAFPCWAIHAADSLQQPFFFIRHVPVSPSFGAASTYWHDCKCQCGWSLRSEQCNAQFHKNTLWDSSATHVPLESSTTLTQCDQGVLACSSLYQDPRHIIVHKMKPKNPTV